MLDPNQLDREIADELRHCPGESTMIACVRVERNPLPIVESGMTACDQCGCAVWISLRVYNAKPEGAEICCLDCCADQVAARADD